MDVIISFFEGFIGIFQAGGKFLVGFITGALPLLAILLTTMNALIAFIGEDKINRIAVIGARFRIVRYVILPFVALFVLVSPAAQTVQKFLKEEHKPAYVDANAAMCHPMTGLFPHVDAGELFVWLGVSTGIATLGLPTTELAIRYLVAGLILAFIRGYFTEKVYAYMKHKREMQNDACVKN